MSRAVTNKGASVRARLLNISQQEGKDFQRVLERYTVERFLYRLSVSDQREMFVLKGATLLVVWDQIPTRPTRDVDFLGHGDSNVASVVEQLRVICRTEVPDDGLVFDEESMRGETIRATDEYDGVRVRFHAILDEARIPLQVDVGFGDAVTPRPEEIEYPVLLGGPAPSVWSYPVVSVVAEKFEAIVSLGLTNTRFKDFYDLWSLSQGFSFERGVLVQAIARTFARRGTPVGGESPDALRPAFFSDEGRDREWKAFLSRTGIEGASDDFGAIGEALRAFLLPVWQGVSAETPSEREWRDGRWE